MVFVFDVSNTKSLSSLSDWLKIFKEYQEAPGVVVGNKIDLTAARYIEIEMQENRKAPGIEIQQR